MQSELIDAGLFFAGVVSGATGLAFPLIAGPIFILQYAPPQAILLTAICSIVGQIFNIALLRRSINFEVQWRMIIPGLLGVPLGTQLLIWADPYVLRLGFGILLVISSLGFLIRRPIITRHISPAADAMVGICGGTCGAVFGASAVLPALWLCLQALDRHRQRAIMQPYIIAMQSASLLLLLVHGVHIDVSPEELVLWPSTVLGGVTIGTLVFRRISCEIYSHAVIFVMLTSGLVLVIH